MKLAVTLLVDHGHLSPPARGRGLKRMRRMIWDGGMGSPPARGRGLKHQVSIRRSLRHKVAPRAGAWIETGAPISSPPISGRRPPRGGVD